MSVELGAWVDPLFLCRSIFHRRVSRFQILKNNDIFVVGFYFPPQSVKDVFKRDLFYLFIWSYWYLTDF